MRPTHEHIAVRAFFLWEKAGRPANRELEFWYEAENEELYVFIRTGKAKLRFPHGNLTVPGH